ncbi:MAG: DUF3883 domain-containing protein [Candidatus Diapherotrites archaeon]
MKREVERKAIEFVLAYEKEQGRKPKELKQGSGYDILSDDRQIEVKGLGGKNGFVLLNENNIKALQKQPNWFLYIVHSIKTSPKLKVFSKVEVLERANFSVQWGVPLRKKDFE